MAKQRIVYLDFLKTMAIFLVITLHNKAWHTDFIATGSLASALQYCVRLFCEGVPIFVLINGFLSFDKAFDAKKHLKKTVNILVIAVLWSVILDVYFTLMAGEALTLNGVLTTVLETSLTQKNTGVLWFLQKLFVLYLVFPILKHLYDTHQKLFNYTLLVLAVSVFGVNLLAMLAGVFDSDLLRSAKFFMGQYALVIGSNLYVVYFMLGGYLRKNWEQLPKAIIILAGGVSAALACGWGLFASYHQKVTYPADFNFSQIFLFVTVAGLFVACSYIPFRHPAVNKVLAVVGDNTMGIYLVHLMVIAALKTAMPMPGSNLAVRLATSLLVMAISLGIACLLRKIPKVSYLVKL